MDCYSKLSSEIIVEINWRKANIAKTYNRNNKLPKKYSFQNLHKWFNFAHDNWPVEESTCILMCWNFLLLIMDYEFTAKICLNL